MTKIYTTTLKLVILLSIITGGISLQAQSLQDAFRLTRSERFDDAGKAFEILIQNAPDNGDIYYYYGDNFLQEYYSDTTNNSFSDLADSARILFTKGTQVDPANPLNYIGLGQIALAQNNTAVAQQNFLKVQSLMPSKANKGIVMSPEKQATVYIKVANAYIKSGIHDTATVFSSLRKAEKLNNKDFDLFIIKGDAYIFLLNDGSKAILNYNIAQSLNPKSPTAKLRVGQLWMRARNYKDALTYYQEVVKIDSTFAPAYRELGYLLSRANRNDEAEQNYKKFLLLSGGNTAARIQYVNILIELKKYDKAIVELNEIIRTDSSNNDLNRALAYSYFETGQYEKGLQYARNFFRRAKPERVRPSDYAYLGRLLAKTKQDSAAYEVLVKAFNMDTSRSELLSEAAISLIKIKNYEKAIDIFELKITLGKANPMDYYNMGKVYYNLQQWGKADSTLAQFNNLVPEHIAAYQWRARALVNQDPDTKTGVAKPVWELMIEKASVDSVKYSKELIEAYGYLAYYYLLQFNATKDKENGKKALEYSEKILALDPNNEKGKELVKQISPRLKQ